jgi:hypothetical protein
MKKIAGFWGGTTAYKNKQERRRKGTLAEMANPKLLADTLRLVGLALWGKSGTGLLSEMRVSQEVMKMWAEHMIKAGLHPRFPRLSYKRGRTLLV